MDEGAATTGPTVQLHLIDEVDRYAGELSGFQLDVVRTGVGSGPNISQSIDLGDVTVATGVIQFPVLGRSEVADDRIVAVLVTAAAPGTRWCEIDVEPGTVLLYGPGSSQTGASPEGLAYTLAILDRPTLEELAYETEPSYRPPRHGSVGTLAETPSTEALRSVLSHAGESMTSGRIEGIESEIFLRAVAAALSEGSPIEHSGRDTKIDSDRIVRLCVEYADNVGRMPSIGELCLVAHVSERRLRSAFTDTVGVPPIRYFRFRMLKAARERLVDGERDETVSDVAMDLGFSNFGRFATQYESVFGELPSTTLSVPR